MQVMRKLLILHCITNFIRWWFCKCHISFANERAILSLIFDESKDQLRRQSIDRWHIWCHLSAPTQRKSDGRSAVTVSKPVVINMTILLLCKQSKSIDLTLLLDFNRDIRDIRDVSCHLRQSHQLTNYWVIVGSNHWPTRCKRVALPIELITLCQVKCYQVGSVFSFFGWGRIRTPDTV